MPDPGSLLAGGAQRILDLLGRYFGAQRAKHGKRLQHLRELHTGLLAVDADYRQLFNALSDTLEDLAAEPDRAAAARGMREATRTLRAQRDAYDAARTSIRAQVKALLEVTADAQTRSYLWTVVAYMLDEDPGLGFPANVPAAVARLMEKEAGATSRTPSSVVLNALEDGSTPDQVLAVIRRRRTQMQQLLRHALELHAEIEARELR